MEVVDRPSFSDIGVPVCASWDDLWTVMPNARKAFIARCAEIDGRTGDVLIDIGYTPDRTERGHDLYARVQG